MHPKLCFLKQRTEILHILSNVIVRFVSSILILLSINFASYAADDYAVFTSNPDFKSLSKNKVRMIFKGKVKRLQGKQIELSDWSENNPLRNDFYQILLGKDIAQMNAYWASLSFSGKARPPKVIREDTLQALISWVSAKHSRIGYAKLESLPDNVYVLYIVKKEKQ